MGQGLDRAIYISRKLSKQFLCLLLLKTCHSRESLSPRDVRSLTCVSRSTLWEDRMPDPAGEAQPKSRLCCRLAGWTPPGRALSALTTASRLLCAHGSPRQPHPSRPHLGHQMPV